MPFVWGGIAHEINTGYAEFKQWDDMFLPPKPYSLGGQGNGNGGEHPEHRCSSMGFVDDL